VSWVSIMNLRPIKRELINQMNNISLPIIFSVVAILAATPALSADMSNWSDKTICRLANEKNSRSRNEFINEVVSRGLKCIKDNNIKKTSIKKIPAVNKSVVSKNIEDTNGADAYKVFKSNFRSSLPECKGNSTLSKLFAAPFSSWNNCWGDLSFKMFTNSAKERKNDKYIGEWKSGRFHGKGAYFFNSGALKKDNLYIGQFYADKFSGKGIYYTFNSKISSYYDGSFLNDKYHGMGTLYFRNGDTFKGQFSNDEFDIGVYTLNNGSKYEGAWKNERQTGHIEYTGIDGISKNQYYVNGIISKTPKQIATEQKIIDDQLASDLALQLEVAKESTLADLAKTRGFFESDFFNEGFELYKVLQDPSQVSRFTLDVKGTAGVISTNVDKSANTMMSRTHYKSALTNSKHGRLVIVSVGSISLKDDIKETITLKKRYKSGTKEIPNTLYFKKVKKLNALYRKLGKNNSKTSISKQYNTYCSSDTMTGVNCSTQPDYGTNARAEIASSAIDFIFDALDGVHAAKKEVRALEKSLDIMSPLTKVATYSDHAVQISSSRSADDYRIDVTYLDLNTNNYEVYSKTYSSPVYTAKIMNENSTMASLEKEVLRDYMKNKNDKIAKLRIVPEDIIQPSTGSYGNRIANINSLFEQILSTEILDNRVLERKTTKGKVLEASRDSSETIMVKSNKYYALIGNYRFISWAEGGRIRKVLLQGMLDGNQLATDRLINLWNDHLNQN